MARSNQASGHSKRPMNKWTHEQRTALHIMHADLQLNPPDRVRAFNALFKNQLPHPLTDKTLGAQYRERVKPGKPWLRVCKGPTNEIERAEYNGLKRTILQTLANEAEAPTSSPAGHDPGPRGDDKSIILPVTPGSERSRTSSRSAGTDLLPPTPTSGVATRSRGARTLNYAQLDFGQYLHGASAPTSAAGQVDRARDPRTPPWTPVTRDQLHIHLSPAGATQRIAVSVQVAASSSQNPMALHRRPYGPAIELTRESQRLARMDLVSIEDSIAHPTQDGLLFRYWHCGSQGLNSARTGFTAGRFRFTNTTVPGPPSHKHLYPDIENHIDRRPVDSPFISTCSSLAWLIRTALREEHAGHRDIKISVIDAAKLKHHHVFHALPFHNELKKQHVFTEGAWRYGGTSELMVWHRIKPEAIIRTISLKDLLHVVHANPALERIVGVDLMKAKIKSMDALQREFKDRELLLLAPGIIEAMATLCHTLGLTIASSTDNLRHVVSDVVQGWKLRTTRKTDVEWSDAATRFATAFCIAVSVSLPTHNEQEKLRSSFLYGVQMGLGDRNVLHNGDRVRVMLFRARQIGLEDPGRIVVRALQNVLQGVMAYNDKQLARYSASSQRGKGQGRLLVSSTVDDEDDAIMMERASDDEFDSV